MSQPLECSDDISTLNPEVYNRKLLDDLDLSELAITSLDRTLLDIHKPGENLFLRPLRMMDFHAGYMSLLEQLTSVGRVSEEQFYETFQRMKNTADTYYVTVIEDTTTGHVIGTTTLFTEQKFIHECAKRARIEDVVVNDKYRGKQLGKFLIIVLTLLAKKLGCYKISLDCRDTMIPFYESLGFSKEPHNGNSLVIRY